MAPPYERMVESEEQLAARLEVCKNLSLGRQRGVATTSRVNGEIIARIYTPGSSACTSYTL